MVSSKMVATWWRRSAVTAMDCATEGLISRMSGKMSRRILLRTTSSTKLELSVTYPKPCSCKKASMSVLPTQRSGLTTWSREGAMPVKPWMPVPRIKLSKMVSTESSR